MKHLAAAFALAILTATGSAWGGSTLYAATKTGPFKSTDSGVAWTAPAVTIGSTQATVYGTALAPGSAGLYQIAIQVPTRLADGDWPIQASIGGVTSPTGVVLSIAH
jgi:uncharacterized protein (TIGR03437 family)